LTSQEENGKRVKKMKGGEKMPKYIVKLTKYGKRCAITLPTDLVNRRGLREFNYLQIKASEGKPIIIRGYDFEKSAPDYTDRDRTNIDRRTEKGPSTKHRYRPDKRAGKFDSGIRSFATNFSMPK